MVLRVIETWRKQSEPEWYARPTESDIEAYWPRIMPALKQKNDLPAVITAVQAHPDWVLSANSDHWGPDLATATALRIVTPWDFLGRLRP